MPRPSFWGAQVFVSVVILIWVVETQTKSPPLQLVIDAARLARVEIIELSKQVDALKKQLKKSSQRLQSALM